MVEGFEQAHDEVVSDTAARFTKRSLVLPICALAMFAYLYQDMGKWLYGLAAVCVLLPVILVITRIFGARRGLVQLGLIRHPLRREMRIHLVQGVNIWLCCLLLAGVVAAGGTHFARIGYSLTAAQFDGVHAAFTAGLLLLALLALVPRRRVHVATNAVIALFSGFLAFQLVQISASPAEPIVLDTPLAGEWSVLNGGRSNLLNGHSPNENNAVDYLRLGANGRTHTGDAGAPLTDYAGWGWPVLAPADGRIVEVNDGYPDTPPGTNGDHANRVVLDIGGDRYVVLAHLKEGSVTVEVGDIVGRGQPLGAVGNSGHTNEPHLHLQIQDTADGGDADRTYPMVFRNVHITRAGGWPWGDRRALRTGDLVRQA